jgi:hypothetical protein
MDELIDVIIFGIIPCVYIVYILWRLREGFKNA